MVKAARCLDAVLAAVRLAATVGRQLLLSNIVPEHVNNQSRLQIYREKGGMGVLRDVWPAKGWVARLVLVEPKIATAVTSFESRGLSRILK